MGDTKAKIDITAGTIELEGSESFVTKYLDEFKSLVASGLPERDSKSPERADIGARTTQDSPATPTTSKEPQAKKVAKKRKGAPKVSAEKYDIHGDGDTSSLKAFFDEKNPGKNNGDRIAVIGYYITEILGNDKFTEGQVEYSYKMLNIDRPTHLHQIMINNKNQKDYYEEAEGGEAGHWVMTRGGDIFVSDELPGVAE